jgi:hypothetical protein
MCFSPEASFAAGGALAPVGVYCAWTALRRQPRLLGLGLMPLFFGLQQISEGFVWLGLERHDPHLTQTAALAFLFFAVAFWPAWFPLFATWMEPQRRRKWLLAGLTLLATFWFWALYLPLLLEPERLLRTEIVHHSISYQFPDLAIYDFVPRTPLRVLYFATLAIPFVLSSERVGWQPGLMLGASAVICALVYSHAFVSVWCFFAALMSAYIAWVFYTLPKNAVSQVASSDVSISSHEPRIGMRSETPTDGSIK